MMKDLIKRLFREAVELSVTDESPDSNSYEIYYNNRQAGTITCGPAPNLGEDTHEILSLFLGDEYTNLNVANQAIQVLWNAHPDVNKFVVNIPNESHLFWEKLGFNRLNDSYHMKMRGH